MEPTQVYYDSAPDCLDWATLRYRWFGVVWECRRDANVVVKYHFADSEESLEQWLRRDHWERIPRMQDNARYFYRTLRDQQESRDWAYHTRLAFYTVLKKPWKNVQPGWYVICSGNEYPLLVTAVERTKYRVWIHHQYLCETDQDLDKFISRVDQEWGVSLQRLSPLG